MKLSFFGMKASTLCVGGSLLLLGGFMSVNLAGCGGGGGGGGGLTSTRVNANFVLTLQSGDTAGNATLTLLRGSRIVVSDVQADDNGLVVLNQRIAPGTYTYRFTLEGEDTPSTGTITILALDNQTYTLFEGDSSNFRYRISGTVFLNPSGIDDPDGNQNTPNCTVNSDPVTAPLLISVRDLENPFQPIVAQFTRPSSESGGYTLSIATRPRLFRIEVEEATDEGEQYAGRSAQTAFPTALTTLTDINVCANDTDTVPISSTATPAPTATPTEEPTTATLAVKAKSKKK